MTSYLEQRECLAKFATEDTSAKILLPNAPSQRQRENANESLESSCERLIFYRKNFIIQECTSLTYILSVLGNHPNIIHLIGISPMMKDEFYIIMEFCDDRDALTYLQKVHREESIQVFIRSFLRICLDVCDAMAYIHRVGYTHRDITASNILVKGGRAKIGDLGLARKILQEPTSEPVDGDRRLGDLLPAFHSIYAPPELESFQTQYTTGCDVYCFGIAVWEMSMLRKWTRNDVARPREQVLGDLKEMPNYVRNVVSKCWHEEDAFRPTFDELYQEFFEIYQ